MVARTIRATTHGGPAEAGHYDRRPAD